MPLTLPDFERLPTSLGRLGRIAWLVALLPFAAASVGQAAMSIGDGPDYEAFRLAIEDGGAETAIGELWALLEDNPKDADLLNLLGFAHRHLAQFELSRDYYERALAIAPAHLGALEYLGELELQEGDLAAAQAIRARLVVLCPDGCHELEELEEALEAVGAL